jgi:fructan beta-fructosidase
MKPMLLLLLVCYSHADAQTSGLYDQPYRPQVHFSPQQHWTNDPTGLVYFEGEYHLFFQHNPFGDVWGHMSWGHAVSKDLVHWQQLPVALSEENGTMIFTGSAVVDDKNTSGFCLGHKPCLVAVYTGHTPPIQTQNIAYSNDRGRSWTKYPGNPVLNLNMSDFRDPDVFWSSEGKDWIMAVSLPNDHKIQFYRSSNLKTWELASEFGPSGATSGQWECPDFFPLPVDGDERNIRWVLKVGLNPGALQGGSGEQYFVGQFDGTRFINDNPSSTALWGDYGKDCYCALTFNNLPPAQKPVMLGWLSNWQYAALLPTSPWRGQMTIPRELSLKTYPEGIRLVQHPVAALSRLRDKHLAWKGNSVDQLNAAIRNKPVATHTFLIEAAMPLAGASEMGWKLTQSGDYTLIGYDVHRHELFVDRTHSGAVAFSKDFPVRTAAPLPQPAGPLQWQILVDRNSVEVFAGGGRAVITNLLFPKPEAFRIEVYANGGKSIPLVAEAWTLNSIW